MKRLLLLLLAALAIPTPEAFAQGSALLYDGFDAIVMEERKVRNVVEVSRTPLFDNAPFLRLRKGDKLVKAQRDFQGKGGKPLADPDRIDFYVLSDGRYYKRWVEKEGDEVLLSSAFHSADNCLLFDWDVTLENARALRKLLPSQYSSSLTREQYDAIFAAVQKEFPEIKVDFEIRNPALREDRIISIPGQMLAEFQGLAYDSFRNCVYKYSVRIGPSVCSITGQTLLQGPRHVERSEFERVIIRGENGTDGQDVDPETAKAKKTEYENMIRFQNVVIGAIRSKTN